MNRSVDNVITPEYGWYHDNTPRNATLLPFYRTTLHDSASSFACLPAPLLENDAIIGGRKTIVVA